MKLIHCLYITLAASLLSACTNDSRIPVEEITDCNKVRYTFSVDLGEEMGTRALTEQAQIRNMFVAVFDAAGYKLSEYVKAELESPEYGKGTNDVNYKYSIELTVSSTERILHFIANAPKSLTYGSESEVIGSLYTSLDNDDSDTFQESYWQRIEMDKIPAKPVKPDKAEFGSNTTAYNAAVAAYEAGMVDYNAAAATLNNIKLIRNYSKVTLVKAESLENFEILGMWLVNYPDRGTVAPYNRNTGEFVKNYWTYTDVNSLESTTSGGGNYHGFMLATTQFLSPEDAGDFTEDPSDPKYKMIASKPIASDPKCTTVGYVYEREQSLASPMYLVVKAKYGAAGDVCYYKVALQDSEGNFYSMLRNFNYLIEIQTVASKGRATALDALLGAPSGDLSLNMEYKELTSISDGEATISVSNTSLMIVGDKGDTKTISDLWYMYQPEAGTVANGVYSETVNPGVEITYDEIGAGGAVINSTGLIINPADESDNTRGMEFTTVPIDDVRKTQTITITGKNLDGTTLKTITRKIDLYLSKYLTMDLSTGPNTDSTTKIGSVSKSQNAQSTVTIGIETGLPSSMFPLDFKIEAARRTLTPDGDDVMPVESGTSTILDGTVTDASGATCFGRPSFWFIKTVTWQEYNEATAVNGKKYFVAKFKNNVTDAVKEQIYVSQEYFSQKEIDLVKN